MDPQRNLRGLAAAKIWGVDPVHPKAHIYSALVNGEVEVERSCGGDQLKRKAPDSGWDSCSGGPSTARSHSFNNCLSSGSPVAVEGEAAATPTAAAGEREAGSGRQEPIEGGGVTGAAEEAAAADAKKCITVK